MKIKITIAGMFLVLLALLSCHPKNDSAEMEKRTHEQLAQIDSLLRDTAYALEMAKALDSSYYAGIGEKAPAFLAPGEDTASITKSSEEEKVATSIAAFYALECSIGVLTEQHGGTPVEWLQKFIDNKLDSGEVLLLNRFANATWKAGQPFRSLERIHRYNFTGAGFLNAEEVKKDEDQLKAAAVKLITAMQDVKDAPKEKQLEKLKQLMQSKDFTFEMSRHLDSSYYVSQKQPVPAYTAPGKDSSTVKKSVKAQKIATSIAGFYALECGVNYLVTVQKKLPSQILSSIKDSSISKQDKHLLLRFANATWKAGQPFRSLDRISRDNFIPAAMLDDKELEKDYVQIKAAAEKLSASL